LDFTKLDTKLDKKCVSTLLERIAGIDGILRVDIYELFLSLLPVEHLGENNPDQFTDPGQGFDSTGWIEERFLYGAFLNSVIKGLEATGLTTAMSKQETVLYVFDPSKITVHT
jgi:hypothetical protein